MKEIKSKIKNEIKQLIEKKVKEEKGEVLEQIVNIEVEEFEQWLKKNSLVDLIKKDNVESFVEIYLKTYIPKSRKIYLSMPYHILEELIYYVIKDVVDKINLSTNFKLELIRTDKRVLGIHKQIELKIYDEIEECDLLIADITNNNPNVFAEIGYKMGYDKAKGIKDPQIILIKNTNGYYERVNYKERLGEDVNEIIVSEEIRRNKITTTAFNLSHITTIEFFDTDKLKKDLEEILLYYYTNYELKVINR